MWCYQVFKSSVKQIPFSTPNMSYFFSSSPVSKPLLWSRALIFSIPNSGAGGITKPRYQVTGERVKTFGCSFVGSHSAYTQANISISSPHVSVKTLRKVLCSPSLSSGRMLSARKVPIHRGVRRLGTGGRKNPVRIKKHLVHSTGNVVPTHLSYQKKANQQVSTITMFKLNPLNG